MKKISYSQLQKKYPLQVVALNKEETKVMAAGKQVVDIVKKLKKNHIDPTSCVLVGPIQKYGTISIYISLQNEVH